MAKILFPLILLFFLILPLLVFAQPPPAPSPDFTPIGEKDQVKVPDPFRDEPGPAGRLTFGGLVTQILNIALAIVGSVAVAFLVYGGFRYITAYGNEEQTEGAKRIIRQAIIGLVIVILSFVIINAIANALIGGRAGVF